MVEHPFSWRHERLLVVKKRKARILLHEKQGNGTVVMHDKFKLKILEKIIQDAKA